MARAGAAEGKGRKAPGGAACARGRPAASAPAGSRAGRGSQAARTGGGDVGQSVRPGVECAFSASRRTFGGHAPARKRENAVREAARKIAIHSAIPGAAGGA